MYEFRRSPTHEHEMTLLAAPTLNPDVSGDAVRTDAVHDFFARHLPPIATIFTPGQRSLLAHILRLGSHSGDGAWTGPTMNELRNHAGSLSPSACAALESLRRHLAVSTRPLPDLTAVQDAMSKLTDHYTYHPSLNPFAPLHRNMDGEFVVSLRLHGTATERLIWLELLHTTGYTGVPRLAYETGTNITLLRSVLIALEGRGIVERMTEDGHMFVRLAERHTDRTALLLAAYQDGLETGTRWTLHPNPYMIDVVPARSESSITSDLLLVEVA